MNIKQYFNRGILLLLAAFAVLSILGTFMGAQRAKSFFNSVPMIIFWCVLLGAFVISFIVHVSLRKHVGLIMIHAGCILVLAGGMYGSGLGHDLRNRLMDEQTFTMGTMSLREGQSSSHVMLEERQMTGNLPFTIHLKEAFVEYYDEPSIRLIFHDGKYFDMPVEIGTTIDLPDERGTVKIARAFRNFKMKPLEEGGMTPEDSPEPGLNPAYEIWLILPDGKIEPAFVFERFDMHQIPGQTYQAEYMPPHMISDYKSVLQVLEGGKLIKEKTIEVNKPLFYGGYHFYQDTFAYDQSGPISGILVASSRGVNLVFTGYVAIFVGLIFQLWLKIQVKRKQFKPSEPVAPAQTQEQAS